MDFTNAGADSKCLTTYVMDLQVAGLGRRAVAIMDMQVADSRRRAVTIMT